MPFTPELGDVEAEARALSRRAGRNWDVDPCSELAGVERRVTAAERDGVWRGAGEGSRRVGAGER